MYNSDSQPNFGMKTPQQIQAEKDQPNISDNNNSRLGAALLGVPVLAGGGYLANKAWTAAGDKVQDTNAHDLGYDTVKGVKNLSNSVMDTAGGTGSFVNDGISKLYDAKDAVVNTVKDLGSGVLKAWNEESTLIASNKALSFMVESKMDVEEAFDFNKLADKAKANSGLLIGGGLAGLAGGMSMYDQGMTDGNAHPVGAALLGAGVLGTAGAGAGHVIHNQIKKNNVEQQDFKDYKDSMTMPPMPPLPTNNQPMKY